MSLSTQVPSPALVPEIAELQKQFAAIKAEAPHLVTGLKESQFNWRPDPHSWSMAECLLHLNMVGDRYAHAIEQVLDDPKTRSRTGQGPFGYGWLGRWILGNTEPPPRSKSKAPRSFTPVYGQPIISVMPTFLHIQDRLMRQLDQSNGLHLEKIKVPAPGLGPVRLNLHLTFAWIAAHQRRHLWQVRQVRANAAFPRA